jgi:rhodanese-related sulfurtransferase
MGPMGPMGPIWTALHERRARCHPAATMVKATARQLVEQALAQVHTRSIDEALALYQLGQALFVDLREPAELQRDGVIPDSFHAPRGVLEFWADPSSEWHRPELASTGRPCVLYCAVGWRSALAARALQEMGLSHFSHLGGGMAAWKAAGEAVGHAAIAPGDSAQGR